MFLRCSYFLANLSLNVLINMVLTQIKECIYVTLSLLGLLGAKYTVYTALLLGLLFISFFFFFFFFFLDASSHLYNRVCPSVRPSVGWLVTLLSKRREINIFEQIVDGGSVCQSIDRSAKLA